MIGRLGLVKSALLFLSATVSVASVAGCGHAPETARDATAATSGASQPAATDAALSGSVTVDGSSTVLPVSRAMADAFKSAHPAVNISVQESGTGGGFKMFCAGEVDITGASRPINAAEVGQCAGAGIEYMELPIAFDSLSVVANHDNTFVDCLTVRELRRIWEPGAEGKVTRWNQVRSSFPDRPITLYGPGTESGTFDYFTLAIVGRESSSRADYTKSDDDTVLINGIAGDGNALGYFGYAYYAANRDKLKLVSVDGGKGCVVPRADTLADNRYQPLSRPIFIYVSKSAVARREAKAFASFYVDPDNAGLVEKTGYVPLPISASLSAGRRLESNLAGSIFGGRGSVLGVTADTFQDDDKIKSALVR